MIKNDLLLALRQLRKNRGYSFINIFGLATGMAIALVIGLWAADELGHDESYAGHERIAEILQDQRPENAPPGVVAAYTEYSISSAVGPFLKKDYKDLFAYTSFLTWSNDELIVSGDKSLIRKGSWAEYGFPLMFGYHFISGSAESLKDPSTVIISRSMAIALYGSENAVGQTLKLSNHIPLRVGGVYTDLPAKSSFHDLDFLASMANPAVNWLTQNTDFNNHSCRLFVKLAGDITMQQAEARIRNICTPFATQYHTKEFYKVYPFEQIYLHDEFTNGVATGGRIVFVRLIGIIGVFVLLLACINFMNLATARSEQRAKEVGIRKTIGSLRSQLIGQFLSESILVAFISFFLAVLLTLLSLSWFSELSGKTIIFPWTSPTFWTLSIAFTFLTGLLAGSYPAFYLSGFRPVKVLKSAFKAGKSASLPRKVLVVAQFSISLSLIIGTIVVFRQIQYVKDRPLGYDQAGLITIPINTDTLDHHYEAVRTAVLNTGMVANMTNSSQTLEDFPQNNNLEWAGMTPEQKQISFRDIYANADFGPTVGWQILQGRDFSRDYHLDSTAAIVNEEGVKSFGFKNPIGQTVKQFGKPYTIIGVVKNIVAGNAYARPQPAIFFSGGGHNVFLLRIKPGVPMRTALAALEPVFKRFNPASPFVYHFNDEEFAKKFQLETRIGNLAAVFSALAIFISCLGLFGLASFVAEQRTKEIGVRKVLGARVVNLWSLLSGDFLKLIVLSMAIAMPLIGWIMHSWLQSYEIHTNIPWWLFVAAGAGMLGITLATVSFQALKAAMMNPIKSLRTE